MTFVYYFDFHKIKYNPIKFSKLAMPGVYITWKYCRKSVHQRRSTASRIVWSATVTRCTLDAIAPSLNHFAIKINKPIDLPFARHHSVSENDGKMYFCFDAKANFHSILAVNCVAIASPFGRLHWKISSLKCIKRTAAATVNDLLRNFNSFENLFVSILICGSDGGTSGRGGLIRSNDHNKVIHVCI